ncbi:DNA polymerase III subunit chi [Cysteiniphilum halobium]|uniref:DNA polymerase III subunit chi n=1 Tax=Cysteiniphilum halobium TaxID=2219059 RepID=UPI0013C3090D|nr:DNA polymerase III subunit chi [Cysteiniphilum halobium]
MNIDFFILPSQDDERFYQFVSVQVKSYYENGKTVAVYAEDALCQELDARLWFDGDDEFLPHAYMAEVSQDYAKLPVVLISEPTSVTGVNKNILIDLTLNNMPANNELKHLVKIVDQEPSRLQASRRYYKTLQQQGFVVNVQKL